MMVERLGMMWRILVSVNRETKSSEMWVVCAVFVAFRWLRSPNDLLSLLQDGERLKGRYLDDGKESIGCRERRSVIREGLTRCRLKLMAEGQRGYSRGMRGCFGLFRRLLCSLFFAKAADATGRSTCTL